MAEACRSCGADVVWVETEAGKAMPLDLEPVCGGNIVRVRAAQRPTVRYLRAGETPPDGAPRYVSHFASCPDASRWRQKAKAG